MKKIFLIGISLLLICGCNKEKEIEKEEIKEEKPIEVVEDIEEELPQEEVYVDENNTPIAIYLNKKKVTEYKTETIVGKDIVKFQIYPSSDDTITYSGAFGQAFHDKMKNYGNVKIGYNLKYSVDDGREFSHNVLHPLDTDDYEGYILLFLYDDYDLYINNKIYSHLEEKDEKNNTLISSIKLYAGGAVNRITSKVLFTVFTYDGEDDFGDNGEYRGNSKYTITICQIGKTC